MGDKALTFFRGFARAIGEKVVGNALLLVGVLLIFGVLVVGNYWDWTYWAEQTIRDGRIETIKFDRSRIVQQFAIVILGFVGLSFAVWRSITAHRQAKAALMQAETAIRDQILNRYTNAAQLIDSEQATVRAAGVFALVDLATDHAQQYYRPCIKLLAECARQAGNKAPNQKTPAEFEQVIAQLSSTRRKALDRQSLEDFRVDLRETGVNEVRLYAVDLSRAIFDGSKFKNSYIIGCDLSNALFRRAEFEETSFYQSDLGYARFGRAKLSGARFHQANISGADFADAEGLIELSISRAWAWRDQPPVLPAGIKFENFFDPGDGGQLRQEYLAGRINNFSPPGMVDE